MFFYNLMYLNDIFIVNFRQICFSFLTSLKNLSCNFGLQRNSPYNLVYTSSHLNYVLYILMIFSYIFTIIFSTNLSHLVDWFGNFHVSSPTSLIIDTLFTTNYLIEHFVTGLVFYLSNFANRTLHHNFVLKRA
jgi:hypothetical protein